VGFLEGGLDGAFVGDLDGSLDGGLVDALDENFSKASGVLVGVSEG